MAHHPLADVYARFAGGSVTVGPELEHRLTSLCERAERSLPEAPLARETFVTFVAQRDPPLAEADPSDEALAELYLVAALRERRPAASTVFEQRYFVPLGTRLGQVRLDDADLDEVKQRARAKLLVPGEGGQLRIEAYAGQGRLAGLVKVVVTREALDLRRGDMKRGDVSDDDLVDPILASWDPANAIAKGRARGAFRAGFQAAVATLTSRDRNLLRLHLLGGVTLESLAEMYGVHRATIVRWLAAARAHVLDETKKHLAQDLQLAGTELESLMAAVQASVDLSVERLLASTEDGGHSR